MDINAVSAASTTDDKISLEESWMIKGEQQAINLQLTNASLYTALQCDLFLPEGLTLARNEQSALQISLAGSNAQSHIIESSPLSSGGIRIVAMSMQNVAFSSNTIATLTISASAEAVGQKTIEVKNVRLVTVDSRKELNAPSTTATVNVMEQRAVLTAKNYTRKYGEANPVFEITTEGPAVDGQPEIICEATATSPVGTYPILVKPGTIRNTCVDYVAGTLTIEKAPLTISAGTYIKKQGDAMPEFTLTYDGFKNGETKDVLTKQPSVTCEATVASAPGEYPVTVSGAEAQNYDISYISGKLVVVDADAIIVKANNYSRVYGDANPTFDFTVDGTTLDGTPEITCEATTTSPVGTYDIVVKQGTVKNYNVSYVAGTLTITKAPLTISAGNYTKKQGDAMPEFTLTYEGFKNGETSDVLSKQPTVGCNATVSSPAGEYPIVVSGAEAQNYEITYVNGKLTVTDADLLTITAKSYTRTYGDANPIFEFETTGATIDGTPEITCDATETSPVGTYNIMVKQGTVKNYNVTYVAGTLTIEKAVLTVTAQNCSRQQGQENPDFTLTYAGWKNSEDENVLLTKPTATTTATKDSPVGEYAIKVSGGDARNYTFEYVDGILTVEEPTGIATIRPEADELTVFTLAGNRLSVRSLKELPQGIYIVNGRKLAVRH